MAAQTNLVKVLDAEKQKAEAAAKAAEAKAKAKPLAGGTVLVRLKSAFYAPDGRLYDVGIHEISDDINLPKSAVPLKRATDDDED